MVENSLWQSLTLEHDNQKKVPEKTERWSPVTNRRYFRRHGRPWKYLYRWGSHSSRSWERWLPGTGWSPFGSVKKWIWASPVSLWFTIRTLTHCRPNSTSTFEIFPIKPHSVVGQHGPVATQPVQPSKTFTSFVNSGMYPFDSANHLEKIRTCSNKYLFILKLEKQVPKIGSRTLDRDTMDHRANSELVLKLEEQSQQGAYGSLTPMGNAAAKANVKRQESAILPKTTSSKYDSP